MSLQYKSWTKIVIFDRSIISMSKIDGQWWHKTAIYENQACTFIITRYLYWHEELLRHLELLNNLAAQRVLHFAQYWWIVVISITYFRTCDVYPSKVHREMQLFFNSLDLKQNVRNVLFDTVDNHWLCKYSEILIPHSFGPTNGSNLRRWPGYLSTLIICRKLTLFPIFTAWIVTITVCTGAENRQRR